MFCLKRLVIIVSKRFIKTVAGKSVQSTRNMMSEAAENVLLAMTRSIVPRLSHQLYKGQCGRIAVIGGCKE